MASEREVNPNIFNYSISSSDFGIMENTTLENLENMEYIAEITSLNLDYIFSETFGEDKSNWPEYKMYNIDNPDYTNALNRFVNKLVIPDKVVLDENGNLANEGHEYQIVRLSWII